MKLYKYKSVKYLEDLIQNKRLYCSKYKDLNDPMEWAFTSGVAHDEIQELIADTEKERWRIGCLSLSEQYGLMWSMYADNHEGVCIEIEIDENKYTKYDVKGKDSSWFYGEVNYCDQPGNISETRCDLKQVLWIKSKQWKHEREVRFVRRLTANEEDCYLPIDKIKCVYIGKRMSDDRKNEI